MTISRRGFLGALGAVPLAFTIKVEAAPRTTRTVGGLTVTIRANLKTLKDGIISAQTVVQDFDMAGIGRYKVEFGQFSKATTIVSGEMEIINSEGKLLATAPIAMHSGSRALESGDHLTTTLHFEGLTED